MSDGDRPLQQTVDGSISGSLYDMRGSLSESTSSASSGGNGYLASTSSSSAASSCSTSFPNNNSNSSAFTTTSPGSSHSTGVIKPAEETSPSGNSRKDKNMHNTFPEISIDTFHTPSTSLQNLSDSNSANNKFNGNSSSAGSSSNSKKISDLQNESQQNGSQSQHEQQQELDDEDEEEEDAVTDSGTASTSIPVTVTEIPDSPRIEREGSTGGSGKIRKDNKDSTSSQNRESPKNNQHKQTTDLQQHKRQNSAGSQCSLSSNPENSQFKTADAHSSDSDVSRNSGTTSGFAFDNCSSSGGGEAGTIKKKEEPEPDRRSIQSDNSHSGEPINTSIESVNSTGIGAKDVYGKTKKKKDIAGQSYISRSSVISSGSSSITSPPLQGSGKPRVKKKMWYQQIFSTSYKTRSADFKKIFKDLPAKERLIVDYSCALQKEILLQGRMYVSQNYVSFYANIFGWETQTSINFKEIDSITKEKTALIIPNAIQISTMTEKFFFSSFVTRDTTYVMLFKLWQSALLEDNLSKKELWRLVHTFYGEELGVSSEDESEEIFCPPLVSTSSVSTLITTSEMDGSKSLELDPEVCTGEIGPAIAVGLNIGSSIITSNGIPIAGDQILLKDASLVTVPMLPMTEGTDSSGDEAIIDSDLHQEIGIPVPISQEALDTGGESPVPEEALPICPVDHTIGKQMLNTIIPCNIDQLFTMLFTNSKFYLDFQLSRKTSDINQSDWQLGDGSQKTRQLTFTVQTGQSIGPKQAQVTETQTLLPESRPGLLYAIQSESVNAGIPYADCFAVNCHYCFTKVSATEAYMVVISKIHYKKSTWAKTFIEKNAMSGLADFFTGLEKALKEECAKMNAGGVTPTSPIVTSSLPKRRHRKKGRAPDIPITALPRAIVETTLVPPIGSRPSIPTVASDSMAAEQVFEAAENSKAMKIILTVLTCLLLLNGYLYFKLSSLEKAASIPSLFPSTVQFSGETPQTHQEWLMVLQQQETLHRTEVQSWHEILLSAINVLHQAEKDLENLKTHIANYGRSNIVAKPVIPAHDALDLLSSIKSQKTDNISPEKVGGESESLHHPENESNNNNIADSNSADPVS